MIGKLAHVTIIVRDQEEALLWYTEKLGFEKRFDERFGEGFRWLTVAPKDQTDTEIVLQKPEPGMHGVEGAKRMAEQIGKGTTWVLGTDDCRKTYETLKSKGVTFKRPPEKEPWGVQAILVDLYGNEFVLLSPR